jgi:hypothetical protein
MRIFATAVEDFAALPADLSPLRIEYDRRRFRRRSSNFDDEKKKSTRVRSGVGSHVYL